MNIKEIKEMLNLMNENNLMELEVEKDGMRVKLKKSGSSDTGATPIVIERSSAAEAPAQSQPQAASSVLTKGTEIKSPMVGTFYRSPSPEAPSYVEIGQAIEPGQVICIIEAMKLMNEIKSEIKGKIKEILIENTEPVEFGQPLFLIEPV